MRRFPVVRVIAGSLSDATAKADLAATYAKVGSAVGINGLDALSLRARELADSEDAVVKFFAAPDGAAPTSSTGMYQVVTAAGAEKELTVPQNTRKAYALTGLSGKYLLIEGKGASGTAADLCAFLYGQQRLDVGKSLIWTNKQDIIATATTVASSFTDIGSFLDICGLSNLTMYVYNSGSNPANINVYLDYSSTTRPTATTTMHALCAEDGAAVSFDTLAGERAAHVLGNVNARWLGIKAKYTTGTTDVVVYLTGVAQGV